MKKGINIDVEGRTGFDSIDIKILIILEKNSILGTLELSKEIKMAPKNLINRLKKYEKFGWVKKETIPAKPKGRKKIYSLTEKGKKYLEFLIRISEEMKPFSSFHFSNKRHEQKHLKD